MTLRAALPAVVALAAFGVVSAAEARADESDAAELNRIERELAELKGRLGLVREFAERGEISELDRARQRFSEAETQFLLENFEGCSALLQDAIDVRAFQQDAQYPQALYYLAESLYQLQRYLEARRYFREGIQRLKPGRQFQDAIVRLIDLSDRTGDFSGIDQYFLAAQNGGSLRPEVVYLYAKWTSHRKDLSPGERARRADVEFAKLQPNQPFYPQALYFRGAIAVQRGRLDEAAQFFETIVAMPPPAKGDYRTHKRVKDLANLALARVYYEKGEHAKATDRYGELARDSGDYNEALFETAATYVKMGNYEQALRTAEILLIVGKDSPVAPEAMLLQANLQLKLERYEKASQSFGEVVQTYGPVKDQIRTMLLQPDPVKYFDDLLNRADGALDIVKLLPPTAQPFVDTNREVAEARAIAGELDQGAKAANESQELAQKLLDTLSQGKLDMFPQLQDGNSAAVQLSNQMTALESKLVRLQVKLLGDELPADVRDQLRRLEEERAQLDLKFRQLPQTQEEYEKRRSHFVKTIAELEQRVAKLRLTLHEFRATADGLEAIWEMEKANYRLTREQEAEQLKEIRYFRQLAEQLEEERFRLSRTIANEKATAAAQAAGGQLEEQLRARYRRQLVDMQALMTRAMPQVASAHRPLLARIDTSRREIDEKQTELSALRGRMRSKAAERADDLRRRIVEEQALLDQYQRQIGGVEGQTRNLLGQIAFDSFTRVQHEFHDIVLKADVGIVDVAWARKKGRSDRIAGLAKDKDAELKRLNDQFREVMIDAE